MSGASTSPGGSHGSYVHLLDLSAGGMGRVELSVRRDGRFERLYAIKRLHPSMRDDPAARAMFVEEGRVAGLVRHPNVVGVLDVGEDEEGPYLVMEYIDGVTVRDLARAASRSGIPLPVQLCCRIGAQAARGLAAAHDLTSHDGEALRLVHRDVSPHNLLVGYDGVARVADFGIARAVGRDHRTSTGVLKGKLGYMSPEILRFEKAEPRSDLFSFGIVLYEMLTASRLYGGNDDAARARRILDEPPPDIGEVRHDVPAALQDLLVRLLAKHVTDRPSSADAVAGVLEDVAESLALEEGRVDVSECLREGFEERRRARTEEIRLALETLEETPRGLRPTGLAVPLEATVEAPAPRRRWLAPTIAVALTLALALPLAWSLSGTSAPPEASSEDVAEAASPAPAPAAALVRLELHTEPEGARVIGPGLDGILTPAQVELPASETALELRFELDDHEPVTERVVPDVDQRLRVQLTRAEPVVEAPTRGRRDPRRRRAPRERGGSRGGFELFGD